MSGSSLVHGNGSAGGTISGGASHFTGTVTNAATHIDMPTVDCPSGSYTVSTAIGLPCSGCSYTGSSGSLSVSGGHNINVPAIAGVDYYFNQITLAAARR